MVSTSDESKLFKIQKTDARKAEFLTKFQEFLTRLFFICITLYIQVVRLRSDASLNTVTFKEILHSFFIFFNTEENITIKTYTMRFLSVDAH